MCNLYTYKLSRDEIRGLMEHYKLVGVEWAQVFEEETLGKNDEALPTLGCLHHQYCRI